ncbi:MAG: 4-hydroxythreonine-4-phosphate dehydrogenase PdxA [bacterium]
MPRILFTLGDPAGIGPEIVLKALLPLRLGGHTSLGVVGPRRLWETAAREMGVLGPEDQGVEVIEPEGSEDLTEERVREVLFSGEVSAAAGGLALASIETAARRAGGDAGGTAIVTAPINKKAFRQAGADVPGHTEWLADFYGIPVPVMLLIGGGLRVAVGTTHVPLRDVASRLDTDTLVSQLEVLHRDLEGRFGVAGPRIAVLALNPHGGAGGEPDIEERGILLPAIEEARARGIQAEGLFSADGFFGRRRWEPFQAVLAPYHDQGLIPVKMEAAGAGVNVTLGLPVIRTSPDHGTAFDIAGRGVASEEALLAAARMADVLLRGQGEG